MRCSIAIALLSGASSSTASGAVTTYYSPPNHSVARTNWMNDIGSFTRIDFTGFANFTFITNQYAHLGVTFTDGLDQITYLENAFLNDNWGLYGAMNEIQVSFAQPIRGIACDFPGWLQFRLYSEGELIFTSGTHTAGTIQFAGLISDQPFDSAVLYSSGVYIDDLYFGPPIPAPGTLMAIVAVAALGTGRRRRAG